MSRKESLKISANRYFLSMLENFEQCPVCICISYEQAKTLNINKITFPPHSYFTGKCCVGFFFFFFPPPFENQTIMSSLTKTVPPSCSALCFSQMKY